MTNEDGETVLFDLKLAGEERSARRAKRCRYRVEEYWCGDWDRVGVHHSRIVAMAHAWLRGNFTYSGNHRVVDTRGPKNG